jgi:hypothetical protein
MKRLDQSQTSMNVRVQYFELVQFDDAIGVDEALKELPHLRFAVGSFDAWPQLQGALDDLCQPEASLEGFHCLALKQIIVGKTLRPPARAPLSVYELAFPEGPVCCTAGLLHDLLRDRLRAGARSLKDALGYWLVPRHATHLHAAVENGKIQLWIELQDSEAERRACQCLLQHSSNSVAVHDLAPLPRRG